MENLGHFKSSHGLENHGLEGVGRAFWNLDAHHLLEEAVRRGEGRLSAGGAIVTETGQHTGRSPNDRFIVEEPATKDQIWWGKVNRPISEAHFDGLLKKMLAHFRGKDAFVQDCYAGAHHDYRLKVRVITEAAWHNLFARNMFIQPIHQELAAFVPDFTVIQAPSLTADPAKDGTTSGTFIVVHLARRMIIIGGSAYAGEIKKSIFSIMNFLMPPRDVLPMHCSANMDEHGWGADGIFNFEGGCYAKTINLTREAEPEIYDLCHSFGSIIENVVMDPVTGAFDFFDASLTENGRVSYDITKVANASQTGCGGQPKDIVMLTCDAFGVLPPISQLTPDQAMYHFLSGYTAKVAGTERGLKEPQATFSTCFGAPFMPRHPTVYAKLLGEKMARHNAKCWLVNTGWSGGGYGEGQRMKIAYTRAMLHAALDGRLESAGFTPDPNFGVLVPNACPNVPTEVLNPKNTWSDARKYDAQARDLTQRFEGNFQQFESHVTDSVKAAAIRAAA